MNESGLKRIAVWFLITAILAVAVVGVSAMFPVIQSRLSLWLHGCGWYWFI